MGKYMKKCKGIGEIGVMEAAQIGVRTRARTLALAAATGKRKNSGRISPKEFSNLRSSRRSLARISHRKSTNSGRIPADRCPSHDRIPISRCSSNGSCELVVESLRSGDLEGECFEITPDFDCRERRETTSSCNLPAESDDLDSTERPLEANSRQKSTAGITPSMAEIEEFFSVAEKDEKKRFAEKYNYDVEKDLPLDGRYEWVRLKA
ncbi:cyclin-dependent kinase inhibitor 3-like [Tasmannia lanceolata]|uniref:cyclin-dependent kinase inhibitor 3-like n=1 Tax=Tasmannia lanceolata TaxID=3420 RepID=UPI0040641E91